MVETGGKESRTPRDILRVVYPRKKWFVAAASAVAFVGLIAAHWMPLEYTGTTKFTLRSDSAAGTARSRGNESLEEAKLTLKHDLLDRNAWGAIIEELGLDRGLPRNASNVELTREGQQAKQKLVASLGEKASLSWEVGASGKSSGVDLLSLSFTDANANMAAEIPNALVKHYIERTSKRITEQLTVSRDFLEKQAEASEARLKSLDSDRIKFEKQHKAVMPESAGAGQSKVDGLKADMTRLSRDRIKARNKLDETKGKIVQLNKMFPSAINELKKDWPQALRDDVDKILSPKLSINATTQSTSQPASKPAGIALAAPTTQATPQPATKPAEEVLVRIVKVPNPELSRLKDMIRQAKDDLNILKGVNHMKEAHPRVQTLKARIEQLETALAKADELVEQKIYERPVNNASQDPVTKPSSDPLGKYAMSNVMAEYQTASQECDLLQGEYDDLEKKYNVMSDLMANFHVVRTRYDELRDKMAKEQNELNAWQTRRNEIQMALEAEVANRRTHMKTVQAAQMEFLPSSPKPIRTIGGVFALAMAIGAALVFLMNFFDRTISTTDKASEFFDLPIHGVIGEIVSKKELRKRWLKKCLLTPTVMVILLGCVATAAMSIILKLKYPIMFKEWESAPLGFISDNGKNAARWITTAITKLLQ